MKDLQVKKEIDIEAGRKLFHFLLVAIVVFTFHVIGYSIIPLLSLLLVSGIFVSEICIRGVNLPVMKKGIEKFDRPENVIFRPGLGVFTLLTGLLLTAFLSFIFGMGKLVTEVAMLMAASDTFSTILGVLFGKTKWAYNRRKSIEGSVAFFASAVFITLGYFRDATALILPAVASLIETVPKFDDNFSIPTVSLFVLKFLGK
jgi:dolichol kinase